MASCGLMVFLGLLPGECRTAVNFFFIRSSCKYSGQRLEPLVQSCFDTCRARNLNANISNFAIRIAIIEKNAVRLVYS